ncbi:hypothetical protein D9M69_559560 [compost metagenome]
MVLNMTCSIAKLPTVCGKALGSAMAAASSMLPKPWRVSRRTLAMRCSKAMTWPSSIVARAFW